MERKTLVTLGLLTVVASSAFAQQQSSSLGVGVGLYMPSSRELRNDLGNSALQFGFGGAATSRPKEGSITPDITAIIANGNGNKLFIVPYTFGYEMHFGVKSKMTTLPYLRPFAGVAYYDYSITDTGGNHFGVKRLGATAGLEGGLLIGNKLKVSAAYNFFTPSSGFNFNGLSLSATYALFSL